MLKMNSLYDKEIISIIDGSRIGEIYDVDVEESSGRIINLIVSGRLRFFGLFGRKEPTIIPWEQVRVVGEETILVDIKTALETKCSSNLINSFLD